MIIKDIGLALRMCHMMGSPLLMWAATGVGKSSAVAQYCKNNFHFDGQKIPYALVDLRCAQLEGTDIRGLPAKDEKSQTVKYFTPNELPHFEFIDEDGLLFGSPGDEKPELSPNNKKCTYYCGILFLDEPNRAEDDVLQSVFQLIYDRRVGEYRLPTGWMIAAAANPAGGDYNVNSFFKDAAMLDRWIHVNISIDQHYYKSWLDYLNELDGIETDIIDRIGQFAGMDLDNLSPHKESHDLSITPSPRSWERVARLEMVKLKLLKERNFDSKDIETVYIELLTGILGTGVANHYRNFTVQISPTYIIQHGLTKDKEKYLKDLLFDSDGDLKEDGSGKSVLQALCHGILSYASKMADPEDGIIDNVFKFGKWILDQKGELRDVGFAFFHRLTVRGEKTSAMHIALVNSSLKTLMQRNKVVTNKWHAKLTEDAALSELVSNAGYAMRNEK